MGDRAKLNKQERLSSFVPFPRQILHDFLDNKLTLNEFFVYVYIRLSADPYGIATISLEDVLSDVLRGRVSHNYCNKILLALRRKRWVYYRGRAGRRGSFRVHLGDWILPDKNIKQLDSFFGGDLVRGEHLQSPIIPSEENHGIYATNKTFLGKNDGNFASDFGAPENNPVRGAYTNTNNDINKYDRRTKTFNNRQLLLVKDFEPQNHDQWRCHEIAKELGFEGMGQILHYLGDYGLDLIEDTYTSYREALQSTNIDNEAAYFIGVLKNKAGVLGENTRTIN